MYYTSLRSFIRTGASRVAKGPIALILAEDEVELDSTIQHHLACGFRRVIVIAARHISIGPTLQSLVLRIDHDMQADNALVDTVNGISALAPEQWFYYCYNAEYLFFPFREDRSVGEMLSFVSEERRDSVLTYVVDLYAVDLDACPNAVSLEEAHLDISGYYALQRAHRLKESSDRQMDFFGGLRWRFEEHVPVNSRRIDRVGLFRSRRGIAIRSDHSFTDPEYNTYTCPWHHSLTAAICSFRMAKALKRNPGSSFDISTFRWHNSAPFTWRSQQLLELGLMEPGQWF